MTAPGPRKVYMHQLIFLAHICKQLGISSDRLDFQIRLRYGCSRFELTRDQAKALGNDLKAARDEIGALFETIGARPLKDVTTGSTELLPLLFGSIVQMEKIMGPRKVLHGVLGGDSELMDAWDSLSAAAELYISTCQDLAGETGGTEIRK